LFRSAITSILFGLFHTKLYYDGKSNANWSNATKCHVLPQMQPLGDKTVNLMLLKYQPTELHLYPVSHVLVNVSFQFSKNTEKLHPSVYPRKSIHSCSNFRTNDTMALPWDSIVLQWRTFLSESLIPLEHTWTWHAVFAVHSGQARMNFSSC